MAERNLADLDACAQSHEEQAHALHCATSLYHLMGDAARAEKAIRASIELEPDSAQHWLGLTEHFHYHDVDLARAAQYVEVALVKALAEGMQVRQVLGTRIRIALEQASYGSIEDSLMQLVGYQCMPGSCDVAYETDFVARIPAGAVPDCLVRQYQDLADARRPRAS